MPSLAYTKKYISFFILGLDFCLVSSAYFGRFYGVLSRFSPNKQLLIMSPQLNIYTHM